MYCKICGKKIPENSKFCRHCGNKLLTHYKLKSEEVSNKISDTDLNKVEYAGFWIRFGAYMIDLLLMVVIFGIIGFFLVDFTYDENGLFDFILGYCTYVVYSTFSLSIWSTSFGKYLYGLKVITKDGDSLTFGIALKRSLLQPISTLFFGIGYWKMSDNNNQAWHDTKAETIVIKRKKKLFFAFLLTIIAIIVWIYLYTIE